MHNVPSPFAAKPTHLSGLKKLAGSQAGVPVSLPCPRCQLTAKRAEETEWLTFYCCADCGWRFAKGR